MRDDIYSPFVEMHLADNENLTRLLALAFHIAYHDEDVPFPKDKLIGEDWDCAIPGQKITITWTDPYRVEEGYLFVLPGLESQDIYKSIVHIPLSYETNEQQWYMLKHLAIFADTVELMPNL